MNPLLAYSINGRNVHFHTPLGQVFQDYLQARKELKPRTLYDYRRVMACVFSNWQNKPLLTITKDEDAQGRSLIIDNPVKRLSQTRAWYRVECPLGGTWWGHWWHWWGQAWHFAWWSMLGGVKPGTLTLFL